MDNKNLEMELERLSKSEYAMPKPNDDEEERRKESDSKKKRNMRIVMTVSLLCIVVSVLIGELGCFYTGFNNKVTSENIGDYLGLFATHCSVVFLTTSLMTMLSEKSKFVYYIDLVQLVLINPPYYNFLALAMYAMESIFLAIVGFLIKRGSLIIGGFLFGIVAIVFLFKRMISVYYRKEYHKNKVEDFLKETIKIVRKIEDKNEVEKYKKPMEKIGYKRQFEAIIDQALIELGNNNLSFVMESVELLEKCIMWHVGTTYDNAEEGTKEAYEMIISSIAVPRLYHVKTKLYLERMYINFASVVAQENPEELQRYYNNAFKPEPPRYLKMIRSIIFPYILNSYIANEEKQKFFICLTKWEEMNEFFPAIRKYLVSIALDEKCDYLAEYYDKLAYSSVKDLDIAIAANDPNSGIGYWISEKSPGWTLFRKHEEILEYVYNESVEAFECILSYKKNRRNFMQVFTRTDEGNVYWDHLDKCIYLSESVLNNGEPKEFLLIFNKWSETLLLAGYENREKDFEDIVEKIISVNGRVVIKTNKDVEYLLEHIYRSICSDEGDQIYILFYEKSEKELKQHSVRMLELYEKALEEGVDLLENRSYYCDKKDDPRNTVDRIKILQTLLDKIKVEREK